MLYLAEVQKKSGGVFGGGKAELKLLACQRGEQSWSAVPGEDVIPADEANNYNAGALVLVDLTANKQIQRIQEAARQLVGILQNFSRLQEKYKTQEEEIEQWKQSLTYQSQELNRREMEMEARREQLEQMQDEAEALEAQRQEFETIREEATRLQEEVERNRQELEGAWEHLRGEMRRLEEQQAQLPQGGVLDEEKSQYIQQLMEGLSGAREPLPSLREQLNFGLELVAAQQSILDQHWQQLEAQRVEAQRLQEEVERQAQELQSRTQALQESQGSLAAVRSELRLQEGTLELKQRYAQTLSTHLQTQQNLHQQLHRLADLSADKVITSEKVNVETLEKMPIEELQGLVQNLQQDLEKVFRFVNDQEEELTLQRQTIDELRAKLGNVGESERQSLEKEIADEQESYQMLNETLVGQRRNLRERESFLSQHQTVLWRRLGHPQGQGQDSRLDFSSLLAQIEGQRQQQSEELQRLESEIEQMRQNIQQGQDRVNQQAGDVDAKQNELNQFKESWQGQQRAVGELWGKVNLYQELLQPVQDKLNEVRQTLETTGGVLNQVEEVENYQQEAIAHLNQFLMGLTNSQSQQVPAS